ncbi:integrase core domain protein [Trichonephila clavipes]|nr:integrase core domain protein [Trichonephila clavipes]
MWKQKIRDLLDYHERAIEVIDSKLKRPESIDADAQEYYEDFKSSKILLSGDDKKSFEELTLQLCMFPRNFTKVEDCSQKAKEALIGTKSRRRKQEGKYKSKLRKEDSCNYRKRKGHWVKDCRKCISDGRPSKNKTLSDTQSNTVSANIALMSISEEVSVHHIGLTMELLGMLQTATHILLTS